jgi:hypothetical protein
MLFLSVFDGFWKTGALRLPQLHELISSVAIFAIGFITHLRYRHRSRGQ